MTFSYKSVSIITYTARQKGNSNFAAKLFFIVSLATIIVLTFAVKNQQSYQQFAAAPQPTPSSISLNPNPPAALGNAVTFTLSYPKATKNPWVSLSCYLDQTKSQIIYGEGGTAAQAKSGGFYLGGASSLWLNTYPTSSVYCTAELGDLYWKGGKEYYNFLATTSFMALGR